MQSPAIIPSGSAPPSPPSAPRSIEDTGIPFAFLVQLACKALFHAGQQRISELAARLRLPARLTEELIEFLRQQHLCDITSNSSSSQRFYSLTAQGRSRADEYLRINQYCGPAPVSLSAYCDQVRRQAVADLVVTRESMRRAFQRVVVDESVLDQFGTAMNSGRALFVHGPAGAGKSYLAEHLACLLDGDVQVPYAILVQDQIVQILDPNVHQPIASPGTASPAVITAISTDARWVACRRPSVVCGGELSIDMLDLRFDSSTRFYAAPPQLKANGGLLVIDDLGRQRVDARELMNRWIVPLDRKQDYLALHTGEKFCVPFDVTLVFCTNLSPHELADQAFLRRLGYKIELGALTPDQYRVVCRSVCHSHGVPYSEEAIDRLISRFAAEGRPLLACTPRDLIRQARDQARYLGRPQQLTPELIDWAWRNYFVARPVSQPTPA
jgi:predicted ATPase with chaperone activity